MAEPTLLYNPPVHVLLRLVTGFMTGMMTLAGLGIARESHDGATRAVIAAILGVLLLALAAIWRTRAVRLVDGEVEVGGWGRRRRLPLSAVEGIDRAWWAFNPTFAPSRLQVRGGRSVPFFASENAESLLAAARGRAASPAV